LKNTSIGSGFLATIINTVIMFTREIIWPFIFFSPLFYVLSVIIVHRQEMDHGGKLILKKFVKIVYYCAVLPVMIYGVFILTFDLIPVIFARQRALLAMGDPGAFASFAIHSLLAYSFMPFLILRYLKPVLKMKESLPLCLWLILGSIIRIVVPSPYWAHYWEPVIFCFSILCYFTLKNVQDIRRRKIILCCYVIANLMVTYLLILNTDIFITIYYVI